MTSRAADLPGRVQRKRTKGWKMPENTVYVGRGSVWGNPFVVGSQCGIFDGRDGRPLGLRDEPEILIPSLTLEQSLEFYRMVLGGIVTPEMYPFGHEWQPRIRHHSAACDLRGKNLACWCPLDQPCHADVLLELANK